MFYGQLEPSKKSRKWATASFDKFYSKMWVGFCLNIPAIFEINNIPFLNDNQWKFEHFHYFNFEASYLKNQSFYWKTGISLFSWKYYDGKHHISIQKPMLRQIE